MREAIRPGRPPKPDGEGLTVNSSPNAVPAYIRMGFSPTGPEEVRNGIRFTPMIKRLRREPD